MTPTATVTNDVRAVEVMSSSSTVEVDSQVMTSAAAARAASPKSPPKEASMPNLDSFAAKLNNFAMVLSEKAKSQPVTVGNIGEIESAIDIRKVTQLLLVISIL